MKAKVPPYTQLLHTMWSPVLHSASTAEEIAAMPAGAQCNGGEGVVCEHSENIVACMQGTGVCVRGGETQVV